MKRILLLVTAAITVIASSGVAAPAAPEFEILATASGTYEVVDCDPPTGNTLSCYQIAMMIEDDGKSLCGIVPMPFSYQYQRLGTVGWVETQEICGGTQTNTLTRRKDGTWMHSKVTSVPSSVSPVPDGCQSLVGKTITVEFTDESALKKHPIQCAQLTHPRVVNQAKGRR